VFGHVTRLKTSPAKSSVIPIQCAKNDLRIIFLLTRVILESLKMNWTVQLRTSLAHILVFHLQIIRKPTKTELHAMIGKVVDYLPRWKASLMTRVIAKLWLRSIVLTVIPMYQMIALDFLMGQDS
jgi:hypothetical protein